MEVIPYYYEHQCIDWSDIGTRIGGWAKRLKPNTIKRAQLMVASLCLVIDFPYGQSLAGVTCYFIRFQLSLITLQQILWDAWLYSLGYFLIF